VTLIRTFLRCLTVAATGLLVACGGGGDSGLSLTTGNAETVAAQSMNTVDMLESMAEMFDEFDDVIENQTALEILCTDGNFTQNINDAAPLNEVSTGDSISFQFNACTIEEQGSSVVFNGGISLSVDEVSGEEGSAFVRQLTFTFDALTLDFDGLTIALDGGFTVRASSSDGTDLQAVIMGDFFSAFVRLGSQSESIRIYDFDLDRAVNAAGDFSVSYNSKITSSQNGGTVTFETVTPFTGNGDEDPSQGQMRVEGDGGGTVTITAIDNVNVQILVDVDDDGTPEATIDTTWAFLESTSQ